MIYYLIAFSVGLFTATGEIIPRYRDEPSKALFSLPGTLYLIFNGGLSLVAFEVLLRSGPITTDIGYLSYALAGGFGAVLILRARFFTVKVGDEEKSFGPGNAVSAFLTYLDGRIDRKRAIARVALVKREIQGIDFDKAKTHIPLLILGARQNLTPEDKEELGARIKQIEGAQIDGEEKAYALGFIILDLMGEDFLKQVFKVDRKRFEAGVPK